VTISGTGFAADPGDNDVRFGTATAAVAEASATQLVVTVPDGAATGPVEITTAAGSTTGPRPFTVDPALAAPSITGFSPPGGAAGTVVTITGSGFDPDPARNTVAFNSAARGTVTAATSTSLTVTAPAVGAGRISVRTAAGTATSAAEYAVTPGGFTDADVDSTTRIEVGGAAVTTTVATAEKVALLRFDGENGQRLSLSLTGNTIAGSTTVRFFQQVGNELSSNEFSRPYSVFGSESLSLPPLTATGTHQVLIDPEGTGTGSIVATLSEDIDAGTITADGPGAEVSTDRGRRVRLAFDGTEGVRYTVALSGNTAPTGTVGMDVRWPGGEAVLASATFSGNRTLALDPLPASGRYQVIVDPKVTDRSFTITLSSPVDAGTLAATGDGTPITSARPGQSAILHFDGTEGELVTLGLTGSTYSAHLDVTVLQPGGGTLDTTSLGGSASLPVLPATGTYELVLSPSEASTGTATVTLSTELDGGTLTTTGPGTTVTVDRAGQALRLRFDGTAGQRLSLGFTGSWFIGSTAADVRRPDGEPLDGIEFLSGEDSLDLPELATAGTYEVVLSALSARTGTATVTLSAEAGGGTIGTADAGTPVTIERPGQNLRLGFDGTAGQRVGLGFTASTFGTSRFSGTYRVSVLRPDGTTLVAPQLLNGESADLDVPALPVTGAYAVVIDPDAVRTGSVTATLSAEADAGVVTPAGDSGLVTVTRPGQDARLRFEGTAGQRVSIGWTGASFGGSWFATVLTPAGATLAGPTLLTGAAADLDPPPLPAGGTYEVVVDPQSARTGSVTATLSAEADAGTVTVGGAGAVATLGRAGQNARLRFDGTAGQQVTLGLSATSFSGFVAVSVLKPDGTALLSPRTMADNASVALAALSAAGTYEILLDPVTGQTGSTTVTLTPTPAAARQARPAPATTRPPAAARTPAPPSATSPSAPRAAATRAPAARTGAASPPGADEDAWTPDAANLRGMDWFTRLPLVRTTRPKAARRGATALAGQVQTLAGRPVAGVTVRIDRAKALRASHAPERSNRPAFEARTSADGRFRLTGLTAGHHELVVDGRAATRPQRDYGTYEIGVDVAKGRTTVLPYPIWLTRIDHDHDVSIPSPTTGEVVLTTPRIPGLEVHVPRGSVIKDLDGKVVRELGITAIPVDRPPFPLPENVIVPIYFTVQPGGAYISGQGARIIYPNYTHLAPRTRVEFWTYDPGGKGWHVYGHGNVTADGKQVVPDPGVRIYEFTGAMINSPGLSGPGSGPQFDFMDWLSGDPVELGTGLFVDTHTDLFLPDVMPISISRTYRQADGAIRSFGFGQNFEYGIFLQSAQQYQEADLVLPNGGKIHYERISPGTDFTSAVFLNTTSPGEWHHSTMTWNGHGWNLTRRDGMTYVFGDETPLQAIRDRHGNQITITRTGKDGNPQDGGITRITSPNGKWIKLTGGGLVSRAEDSTGRVVEYGYDSRLRLTTVTDPAGKVTTYGWNEDNQVATITDPRGITYLTNEYNGDGRVRKQTMPEDAVFEFVYTTSDDRVVSTQVTDPNGHVRRVVFNENGFAVSETVADGTGKQQATTMVRSPLTNLVVRTIDPLGRETAYEHDALGNITVATALDGTDGAVTTRTEYDGPFNQMTAQTDPLGNSTRYGYDGDGNLVTVTDPEGRTARFTSTPSGEVATSADHRGKTTTMHYELGELTRTTDPLGRTSTQLMDAAGRVLESTDPTGASTRYTYDARNQPSAITDPLGQTTELAYDDNGNLLSRTDARGHTARWTYDAADRVVTATDPLGRTARSSYDPAGNLTTVTARSGKVTTFAYDELDHIATVTYDGGGTVTNTYDGGNRLTRIDDSETGTISQTVDDLDRVTVRTTPQGTISYGFDDAGRRTSMQVTGQPAVVYAYNRAGQPTSITKDDQAVGFAYDDAGRPVSLTLPGGITQASAYDDANQLTGITHQRGEAALGELTYGYDQAGRRTSVGGSSARVAIPDPLTGGSYDDADQLTARGGTSFTYDDDGNLTGDGTTTYTWDARGRLAGIARPGLAAAFAYDAMGRRVGRTINGATVGYLHDGDTPVQELDGTTATANLLTGGTDAYYARTDAGGTKSFLTDALGSTVGLAGDDGPPATEYTYEPFGAAEATGEPDANTLQFTGRESDGTGLQFNRARYYDLRLQRFLSRDPIGYAGGGNLYAYAGNSPANFVDPQGTLLFLAPLVPIAASFLGGALLSGAMSWGMQRLSGRKVDWSQVAFDAFVGGALNVITAGLGAELALADDLARVARPCNSFAPQTPVRMADGTSKPIEDVEEGDEVLATDPLTGETGARPVTALIEGEGVKELVDITVPGGTITATDEHPLWEAGSGAWVEAGDLEAGDRLRTADGGQLTVRQVAKRTVSTRVNNLTVAGLHTYYVEAGAAPVLVHNSTGNCTRLGVVRDNPGDWKKLEQIWEEGGYGDILSQANKDRIADRLVPRVDDAWIEAFPGDAAFIGEKITIHHVGGTQVFVPLSKTRHMDAHMPGGYRYNPGGAGGSG
jgi:RHS repeat-associated protein